MTNPQFDLTKLSQENINAIVKASEAAASGFQHLSKYIFELASKSIEESVAASKMLSAAKTPVEFAQIQFKLAQESLGTMLTETRKISELAATIAKDASEPLTESLKSNIAAASKSVDLTKKPS